jgi:cobalt-zinc-cadmium efflux system membrane fusion protein
MTSRPTPVVPPAPPATTSRLRFVVLAIVVAIAATATFLLRDRWRPTFDRLVSRQPAPAHPDEGDGHDHDEHDHGHGHDEGTALELSPQARKNLGLTAEFVKPIALTTYRKTISVPAVVAERPGRTHLIISAPMTGIVTEVAALEGGAVEPGALLFRIRLTHEDLVQSQTDFVRSLGELDVEKREITRLEAVTQSGAIAGKTLLERQYAKERLEAHLSAQREALRLHGLSSRQVDQIAQERRLLNELRIVAPGSDGRAPAEELQLTDRPAPDMVSAELPVREAEDPPAAPAAAPSNPLVVEQLNVQRGQSIEQGGKLCALADYSQLYIEGRAFEQDAGAINQAVSRGWKIAASFPDGTRVDDLPLVFVSGEIDAESRTLKFYVDLPNTILRDSKNADGQRFLTWKYRPGQRLQLRVPVEEWPDQIVLPVDAVAQEGAEAYVFEQNGKHFDRVSVHVLHRDQTSVVIANDGSIFPGAVVARRSAHQMQMALKNQAGGAIDPHAGHNH